MDHIYFVRLNNGMRCESAADGDIILKPGDFAILKREHSLEYVQIQRRSLDNNVTPEHIASLPRIQRVATVMDRATATENEAHAKSAYRTACQMVEKMNLPMKLLNANYSFDRKLVTIQFTADGRVDFRELVKELSHALNCRLDLRQIGVRDETGICGGIAVCGQVLCCSRFLREFNSINVKMAKDQDLSLTPTTISGVCGRLKCCLKYEHDGYVEMEKEMPRRGELCECEKGRGRVSDRNMLTKKVTIQLEDGGSVTLPVSEVKYRLRSGKKPPESPVLPKKTQEEDFTQFEFFPMSGGKASTDAPGSAGNAPEKDSPAAENNAQDPDAGNQNGNQNGNQSGKSRNNRRHFRKKGHKNNPKRQRDDQ